MSDRAEMEAVFEKLRQYEATLARVREWAEEKLVPPAKLVDKAEIEGLLSILDGEGPND